jgi:hypothetical protein
VLLGERETLRWHRRVLGDDHPTDLAEIRRAHGNLDGARELHEQARQD